ncbi:hypothetical protein, partial [Salmonella sp. s60131]|uniref:hypothetical protein n=1 Tax=Salmonella sp. s60131 TaxID=3159722 RepID=UPI00397FF125
MMRQRNFESANKVGKLLAWQLKWKQKQKVVNKLVVDQKLVEDPREIVKVFRNFYRNLYTKKKENPEQMDRYFRR